jgi:hypothetical protein
MNIPEWVENQVGELYGKLRVVEIIRAYRRRPSMGGGKGKIEYEVKAECECGNVKTYLLGNLRNRHTSTCGCGQRNKSGKRNWNSRSYSGAYS